MLGWRRRLSAVLAAILIFQQPLVISAQEGFIPRVKSKLVGMKRSTEYNNVEMLAKCIDKLEEELLEDGTVVAKAPDVWGEARLTAHRAEFEQEFRKKVADFEVRLNASVARTDQAFLASALLLNASLAGSGKSPTPSIDATQINNMIPALTAQPLAGTAPADEDENAEEKEEKEAAKPTAMNMFISQPGQLTDLSAFAGFEDSKIKLEQTIELDQMARYLNHLHEIRRMNEGDDTADSPGYSLNLVRIPVSIMPGSKTRKGHAAEITVTAEAHVTDELLPATFRALVINDLVDQLAVPIVSRLDAERRKQEALRHSVGATKNAVRYLAKLHDPEAPAIDLDWLTIDGFRKIVDGLAKTHTPEEIEGNLNELREFARDPKFDEASLKRVQDLAGPAFLQFTAVYPAKSEELIAILKEYGLNVLIGGKPPSISDSTSGQQLTFAITTEPTPFCETMAQMKVLPEAAYTVARRTADSFSQVLDSYAKVNAAYNFIASSSGHRRARSPLSAQNVQKLLGSDIDQITRQIIGLIDVDDLSRASAVRNLLRDELDNSYETVFDADTFAAIQQQDLASMERNLAAGRGIAAIHEQFHSDLTLMGIEPGSLRSLLAWPILVESLLLSRQLNADIRHVSKDPDCGCMAPGYDLPFYGMDPPAEARNAFVQYVKCRWPIHVFALDPMTQDQNIADQYSMRRELQLAMAMAVATGRANAQSATRYARRLEMDMETVALNRTAVAFGHGKDTFGWRFMPRVQTPEFESNGKVALRDLLIGGPDRDALRSKWELEPGMRECVAVVLMPSFITHIRFDCRGHFMPLVCDDLGIKTPADARTSVYDTVEMSRMIREMQNCAMCAMNESHLYRDGEVDRLLRRVDQLSARLPLQTSHSRVPNENTLGGFEMFSSGVTDLAPELYDWYGEPGFKPGDDTTIFLIGSNFSVTGTRVIAGNRDVDPHLLSREVMEITIPKDAVVGKDGSIDIHVATPYGVSQHVHVPIVEEEKDDAPPAPVPAPDDAPRLSWGAPGQSIIYRWNETNNNNVKSWDVSNDGVLLRRPHKIVVRIPDAFTKNAPIPAEATLNVSISMEGKESGYLVLGNANAGLKYAPDEQGFVVEGTALQALHDSLKSKLVAKLKTLDHNVTPPPGPIELQLTGFITPKEGFNPRVEVAGEMKITIGFAPEVEVPKTAQSADATEAE